MVLLTCEKEDHTMSVMLTSDIEERIQSWIDTGGYPDASAVILDALAALEEQEHAAQNRERELVLAGFASGDGGEFTAETWAEIAREADEADRLGLPIRREVQP
jgi:putative addiction module CopG family antidote